jgi:hypothetical protein
MNPLIDYDYELQYADGVTYRQRVSHKDIFLAVTDAALKVVEHRDPQDPHSNHGPVVRCTVERVE